MPVLRHMFDDVNRAYVDLLGLLQHQQQHREVRGGMPQGGGSDSVPVCRLRVQRTYPHVSICIQILCTSTLLRQICHVKSVYLYVSTCLVSLYVHIRVYRVIAARVSMCIVTCISSTCSAPPLPPPLTLPSCASASAVPAAAPRRHRGAGRLRVRCRALLPAPRSSCCFSGAALGALAGGADQTGEVGCWGGGGAVGV